MNIKDWEMMTGKQKTTWLESFRIADSRSLTLRKMVYSTGVNDSPYRVRVAIDGAKVTCPAYKAWQGMIERCYSKRQLEKCPTYKRIKVCDEWHTFMAFREWWLKHQVDGWQLDKDLLIPGNDIYSPKTCIFVPHYINCLLTDKKNYRGKYPIGVTKHEGFKTKPYEARVNINGKPKCIGSFDDPCDAHLAYLAAKLGYVDDLKQQLDAIDSRLYQSIRIQILSK